MHRRDFRSLSLNVLAVATVFALSGSVLAGPPAGSGGDMNRLNMTALEDGASHERFIIHYREGSPERGAARSRDAHLSALGRQAGASVRSVRQLAIGADLVEVGKALNPHAAEAFMRAALANPNVDYIEPDATMYAVFTPNDTRYNEQWHYHNSTGGLRLPSAWDRSTGSGVRVAVLDTGSTSHSDLNANYVGGYDFVSNATNARDGNGRDSNPQDQGDWSAANECYAGSPASNSSWHGTHVSGTVAAVTNNASGVAGVAFGAKVVPVRVLAKCGGSLSDIADAIVWASGGSVSGVPANANPAEVINMSLGGSGSCGTTYQNAINSAVNRGTTVVVAAGNSNTNVSNSRPANCSNVIAVAATTSTGARASFSNYGAGIDVSAPGQGILSTLNSGTTTPGSASYASYNGTSMAAPHVAGVVALMQAVSTKTPAQVEQLLKSSARPLPGACSGGCGAGIVDANAAVIAAQGGGGGGGSTLSNGVPVSGISGASGSETRYTMAVPSGASNLSFQISGGTGDADMYVKFGSAPTTASYDCRPYLNGNNETCNFASPQVGTYHVMLRGYTAYSGVTLVGSHGTSSGPSFFENQNNYTINDHSTVESPITVSGRSGNAPSNLRVAVRIIHTYIGDLKVDVVSPSGAIYTVHNRSGGSADNIITTYTVNASGSPANGTWRLRVNDNASQDTGYIDSWSLQF